MDLSLLILTLYLNQLYLNIILKNDFIEIITEEIIIKFLQKYLTNIIITIVLKKVYNFIGEIAYPYDNDLDDLMFESNIYNE